MRYVIVAAGLAGLRAAEAIRELDAAGSIALLGAEPELPYSRPPLSKEYLVDPARRESLPLTLLESLVDARIELRRQHRRRLD